MMFRQGHTFEITLPSGRILAGLVTMVPLHLQERGLFDDRECSLRYIWDSCLVRIAKTRESDFSDENTLVPGLYLFGMSDRPKQLKYTGSQAVKAARIHFPVTTLDGGYGGHSVNWAYERVANTELPDPPSFPYPKG